MLLYTGLCRHLPLWDTWNWEMHSAHTGFPVLFEILNMATTVNSKILNMQDRIGTIEKGKYADILAVDGNPLKDLNALDRVHLVMKEGCFIKRDGIRI